VLQFNELGDDGVTRFNFRDTANFMRVAETIWVAFYATLPLHMDQRNVFNTMQWNTLNNVTGSSILQSLLADGATPNRNFMFRDASNFLNNGFTQWTTAVPVEQAMQIPVTTNNMAWAVSFQCQRSVVPTAVPTSPTPPATTWPPLVTDPPLSPTVIGNGTNESAGPISVDEDNETLNHNSTKVRAANLDLLWLITMPAVLFIAVGVVGYVVWRQRRKLRYNNPDAGKPQQQQQRQQRDTRFSGSSRDERSDDSRVSLASFFDNEASLSADNNQTIAAHYFSGGSNNVAKQAPVMMQSSGNINNVATTTRYDRNNPFSRRPPNNLLVVSISDDGDDSKF
jgi:hypothetical protein